MTLIAGDCARVWLIHERVERNGPSLQIVPQVNAAGTSFERIAQLSARGPSTPGSGASHTPARGANGDPSKPSRDGNWTRRVPGPNRATPPARRKCRNDSRDNR